jgi:hypothetical protein
VIFTNKYQGNNQGPWQGRAVVSPNPFVFTGRGSEKVGKFTGNSMQTIEFVSLLRQVQNISERNLIEREDPFSGHSIRFCFEIGEV